MSSRRLLPAAVAPSSSSISRRIDGFSLKSITEPNLSIEFLCVRLWVSLLLLGSYADLATHFAAGEPFEVVHGY